jgi:hypothetical protein
VHCNGRLDEMVEVLDAAGDLEGESADRVTQALAQRTPPRPFDPVAAEAHLADLLRGGASALHE